MTDPVASRTFTTSSDTILIDDNASDTPPELLVSAVLQRITQFNTRCLETGACAQSAATIEYHLRTLAGLPNLAAVLRATCLQLSEQWTIVAERAAPKPPRSKSTFMARLVSCVRTN